MIRDGLVLPRFDEEPANKIILGLGFGDEGKGMAVAYETARSLAFGCSPINVRFNGGPQAAHNVRIARSDGVVMHHTHSQFGSGSMLGATTVVTSGMLVNPMTIASEATHLSIASGIDVLKKLVIDARCPVVLPMHIHANQEVEKSRNSAHGSTGNGVGIARWCEMTDRDMTVTVMDLFDTAMLVRKIGYWSEQIQSRFGVPIPPLTRADARAITDGMMSLVDSGLRVLDTTSYLSMLASSGECCFICEGSQGIMLDQRYGFFPHVTFGDMSSNGVPEVIRMCSRVVGVTRSYATRHGNGPFPVALAKTDVLEKDNEWSEWAGSFRIGVLDLSLLREGAYHAGADEIFVSCLDRYGGAVSYDYRRTERVCAESEETLLDSISDMCAPVTAVGRGETIDKWQDKIGVQNGWRNLDEDGLRCRHEDQD